MKKKIITTMLILAIPTSIITGCGKSVSKIVADAVTEKAVNIVEDAVALSDNPTYQYIKNATDSDDSLAKALEVSILAEDNPLIQAAIEYETKYNKDNVYSTDEFISLMWDEIDKCYQNDESPDASPCKRLYTKDENTMAHDTLTLSRQKDFVEDYYYEYEGIAELLYLMADSCYLEVTSVNGSDIKIEYYINKRDSINNE
jgi:hypothetical protein